jgi:hypothetical protein
MNTFTAQDMEDYAIYTSDPDFYPHKSLAGWCIDRSKPTKKVIDLTVLVDSQIDCEFSDRVSDKEVYIGKLFCIFNSTAPYKSDNGYGHIGTYIQCQPRMNHIHAWQGGECPLPEGFRVKVWWRSGEEGDAGDAFHLDLRWSNEKRQSDIIQFEVLGLADGYVMPWESE